MTAQHTQQQASSPTVDSQPGGEPKRKQEHLGIPQSLQGQCGLADSLAESGGRYKTPRGESLPHTQPGANAETDDHRPAGTLEEVASGEPGHPQEAATERDGYTIVSVAAEDAHEEHEHIDVPIVAPADTHILPYEKGHHALRCQIEHRLGVQREQASAPGQEEEEEKGGEGYLLGATARAHQAAAEPHQQREE